MIFDTILSAGKTGLLSAIMTAIVSSVDTVNSFVKNKGFEYSCAGYVELSRRISLIKAQLAELERKTKTNELNGITRDLVEVLYEVLFAMATDLKMPKNYSIVVTWNASIFVSSSNIQAKNLGYFVNTYSMH